MSQRKTRSLFFASLTSLILAVLSYAALSRFSESTLLPCMEPRTEILVLSLSVVFFLQIFLAARLVPDHYLLFLAGHMVLILLAIWLGAYAISPLGYSTGRIPNLRGFTIIRAGRSSIVRNNEIVSLKAGSAVGINLLLLDETSQCMWISAAGAALDDPSSCDTVYVPPSAEHDVLRVRLSSACGLPDSNRWIRISILP
jgi:hypothetical protein